MKEIKTAIIGYGYAGEILHAPLIERAKGLKLCGVSTSKEERRQNAQSKGLKVYSSGDELIRDPEVDLVVIATPHDTHEALAVQALNAGKHVVTDKLMCMNADQAEHMMEAARRNGRMLTVFHNRRWDGDYLTIKKMLDEEILGEMIEIKSFIHSAHRPSPRSWRGKREKGGGIFSDWGAHLVDQAVQLNPTRVTSVYCRMDYVVPEVDVETSALCILEFESGCRHVIESRHLYHSNQKGYTLLGDKARVEIKGYDPQEAVLRELTRGIPNQNQGFEAVFHGEGQPEARPEVLPGNWEAFYENVAQHILQGNQLLVTPESVKRMMEVRDAAFESARTKQVVRCMI